eukprot:SAG22_NODE_837_length_6911_cov_4.576629_8_plen_108_part_00
MTRTEPNTAGLFGVYRQLQMVGGNAERLTDLISLLEALTARKSGEVAKNFERVGAALSVGWSLALIVLCRHSSLCRSTALTEHRHTLLPPSRPTGLRSSTSTSSRRR